MNSTSLKILCWWIFSTSTSLYKDHSFLLWTRKTWAFGK